MTGSQLVPNVYHSIHFSATHCAMDHYSTPLSGDLWYIQAESCVTSFLPVIPLFHSTHTFLVLQAVQCTCSYSETISSHINVELTGLNLGLNLVHGNQDLCHAHIVFHLQEDKHEPCNTTSVYTPVRSCVCI